MFDGITELTKLEGFKTVDYSTERSELINEKNIQKNDEFQVVRVSIINEFDTAIQLENSNGNSNGLKGLLTDNGYNDTDAVIDQLDTIIEVNKDIKSKNANLERLETEKKKLRDSLTNLNAQKKKEIGDLEAENNKLAEEIEKLEAEKVKIEEEKNALNVNITSSNGTLELKKQELQTKEDRLTKLTKRIDEQNEEIANLNVEILKHTANQNMLDIKIKHYQGLKETSNKAYNEQRSTLQKEIENLEKKIDELEKKSLEYDTDKIKRKFDSELKDAIQNKNDNTIITSTGYVGKEDELSNDFPIDSKVLYGENTDFKNMGDILSGIGTIRMSQAKNVTLDNFSNSSVLSINLVEMNDKLLEQTGIQ